MFEFSTTSIIIMIACAAGIVLLLILYRLLSRREKRAGETAAREAAARRAAAERAQPEAAGKEETSGAGRERPPASEAKTGKERPPAPEAETGGEQPSDPGQELPEISDAGARKHMRGRIGSAAPVTREEAAGREDAKWGAARTAAAGSVRKQGIPVRSQTERNIR